MAALFYIYIYICLFPAFSWGQYPYLGCDAFLGVSVFLSCWTALCCSLYEEIKMAAFFSSLSDYATGHPHYCSSTRH